MSDNLAEQLYWASSDGRDQEVLELLQKGAPPNNSHYYSEQGGGTPLHRACANNHIRSADLLIKFGAIVAAKNNDGYIPLHWACVYNSMDTARLLLEHHCPTDIKDIIERTAADLAREYGYDALADYVEGFQPGPRDPLSSYPTLEQLSQLKCECDQWLLLGVCLGLVNDELETIKKSQHPTAETLKEAKIKNIGIQWKDIVEALVSIGEGKSALSVSAFCGWLDCVKHFVKTVGLDPKEPVNKAGDTPLSLASANGHLDTVKYLANEHHCDPRKPVNKAGDTPLSLACANGHLDTVKYLVNEHHCVPRSTVNKAGDTPLSLAYKGGHWEVVKYLAQEHQCDPKFAVNEAGDTPLSLECSRGDLEMVKALINKHVDTNKPVNKADDTPLSLACANGHLDTVKYLVNEHHCDPRKPVNKAGDTPLSLACANGHLDTVKYLVNEHHCVPRSTVNKAGDTPLSLAYKGGHWEVVKYLAQEHQCDPKFAVNEAGDTPLSLECSRGDLEMVKALINKHVDTNKPVNKADDTPLSLACANGHLDTVKYLVNEHHCDPSKPVNKAGDTPLSLACANGHLDTVKYLVNEHHCDPRKPVNKAGDTPLSLACANGHLDTVKYLVNKHHCVPRSTVNKAGDTPFSLAYKGGHWEVVKYLAQEHQCDPKFAVNEAGDTPLSLECSRGDLEMVKALINMRVDPNKPVNKAGDTSLSLAYQGGHWEVVKYLAITHHCDTTIAVNEAGDTPLSLECSRGDLEMVKALMNKRVDPNKPVNKAGDTPLSLTCTNGHLNTVKYLVNEHHCDIRSTVNKAGDTPLSLTCTNGHLNTVKYLVNEHHCDIRSTVNKAGDTPLSLAYKGGHWEVAKYLVIIHHCDTKSAVNEAGDTPLSLECSRGDLEMVKALMNKDVDPNSTNKAGDTPLSLAYKGGHWEVAKYLVITHHCDTKFAVNEAGDTPLSLECSRGDLEMVKALINKDVDPNKPVNKAGDTPLSLAYNGRHWEVAKYLVITHHCDTEFAVNEAGDTPLSLEFSRGDLEMVKALMNKDVDPNKPVNKAGDTPLFLAFRGRHWEVVKYLAIIHHCDTKSFLLLAVKYGPASRVEFLLAECHSDPNVIDKEGKTPLDLSNDPNIIKLLLKHGAKVANVYKEHSKLIGKLSSERPPHLPLFVLLTGDGGVGKSTLLKSILTPKGFWSKLLQKARPVDGVDTRTVGIIPYEVYTKEFGRIIYFDFAGQKEFYTSHCAILENAVQTSPPIIILCAKLVESEQAIIDSMIHWLTLVQNQCTNLKDKAHVIVVGSHADQVKEMGEDPRAKESIFAPIIKQFPKFEFTEFIPMDCRFADSVDMKKAKRQIQKSSAILRSPETISLNAHTFYIYLVESFKDDLALLLGKVHEKIKSDLNEDLSKRTQDILSFIPSTISHLVEICDQLHKRGLLLFLRNDSSPEKSFLVIDQATLLSTVTGTVFAPESFRQHCKLASSTGVVPLSKFSKAFNGFDIEMLIAFMSHLELCFEIIDKKVLDFISKEIASSTDRDASVSESDTRYLFFPGLIRIETPDQVWKHAQSIKYHFGWIFETSQDTEFYDPRCLQVLILRIVFTFRLAPARKILLNIPSLQRFCSVWKSGICWCNDDGITAHLELAENGRSLVIKMRSDTVRPEGLIHRSRIVSTIRETVESFGRNVNVIESIIDPNEVVKHPLKNSSDLPLVDIKDIAAAVSSNKSTIKSTQQVGLTFEHLFQFEPYAGLDQATIQCIHSNKNVKKNEKISRAFISHFAELVANSDNETPDQVARNSRMYRRILSQFQALVVNIQSVSPRQEVVQALERWRSETEGTYSCLRDTLNKYSVFTGRNPLDLAGVAHDDIDLSVFRSSASRDEQYDPGTTSLHELMVKHRVTDEQLDREIKQDDFAPVAMHFDDVELYLNPLKLTDNEQADVRRETYLSRSNQVAVINCLSIWRGHEPSEATFRALIRILLDLRKAEIATKIVQYLNEIKAQ
ncbi:uncharacterized protein LOC135335855 isoform X9 [Halichondria panicea]|uniref:uncharacterized protein LOC135335855 isoform X9 n=1 Tax=Halichondria panicea TaxID=6063 RepID=UPI00312BB9A6